MFRKYSEDKRLALLARFIDFLEDKLGYRFKVEEEFDKRFRLQKYVFLARSFGLDLGYDFNLYMYGPYSPTLASDYYKLSEWRVRPEGGRLPEGFRAEEFVKLLREKDDVWLEGAATLLHIWDANKTRQGFSLDKLVEHVSTVKPHISDDRLREIVEELSRYGLLG